jgi:hypothetical protein
VLYAIGAEMDAASSEAVARAEQNEALENKDHGAAVNAIEQFFYKEREGSDGEADFYFARWQREILHLPLSSLTL